MADKEGKNFSLRQRKSKRVPISAPKPISNPINDSQQPQQPRLQASKPPTRPNVNGRTDTGGINTADLVKRRYSTRFTQPVDFKDASAPSVPSVPAIPTGYGAPAQPRPGTAHKAQKVLLDSSTLKDPNLQTEKYANDVLADATDQEIRDFQSSLRKLKHRASSDLQQNVYQNRTQFIKISKEAEKLKGEMRTLRSLMSELTTSFSQASAHAGVPEPTRRVGDDVRSRAQKQANRSSVANLEAMWSVQMHALWKNVEGSQKYLPAIPGRHVVLEQSSWLELDAATWKAKRHAHLFLLNDHLLIATRRKKRLDPNAMTNGDAAQKATTRLIADKCWALQDIDLVDLASTGSIGSSADQTSMANAVSIRCGNESFTYRSEKSSPTEKTNLLLAFRRTTDELRKTMRVDMEENSKSKDTLNYLSARDPALSNNTGLLQSLSGFKDRSEILIEVDGKHQNLRWVEGQIDDLDSEIALHRFEAAVTRIEKLRRLAKGLKGNMIAQELMTTKVDERARKLSEILTHNLTNTSSSLTPTLAITAHLTRLSLAHLALSTYLSARTSTISSKSRAIIFQGDLLNHISQLSYVYFALIRNTVRVYQQCFPPGMMSACVKWAKEQLDEFNEVLWKQLGSVVVGSKTWVDCLGRAKEHAGMCREVGLEFVGLVRVGKGGVEDDREREKEKEKERDKERERDKEGEPQQ